MQEFIVSNLEDENDGDFSQGDLSLREAISNAESGDTITFNSNLGGGTIDLSLGELAIDKSLTIRGLGADQLTIRAVGVSRVFNIDDGNSDNEIDVILDGLTITNGLLDARSGFFDQGSSFDPRGSGILTTENLDLLNSSVLENETDGDGGGIYSFGGRLRIDNSIIENNRAEGARSRLTTTIGGGVATIDTTVEITNSSITGNFAGLDSGGGLDFRNSQVTITDSSIANNTSYGAGGINSINSTVDISRTVITGNETGRSRGSGAINSDADSILNIDFSFVDSNFDFEIADLFRAFASGISARGTTTISNSTISNNTADSLDAGYGIRNTGDLSIVNSTFAGNSDGGINNDGGTVNISNTTIADRLIGADLANLTSTIVVDDSQELEAAIDENNNLIGNSEDFELGELQDNGGFAPTVALSENSPAIDAGSNLGSLATDQRGEGFDRTVGGGTDIGAFELQTVVDDGGGMIPDELVVSTLEDENDGDFNEGDLSLREAIAIAEAGDTVTFDPGLSGGTINLALGDLAIDKSLNIQGLGADQLTIDAGRDSGNFDVRVFNIDDGNDETLADVNINGLTITGGNVGRFFGSNAGNIANAEGGGIFNAENLRLEDSVIRDNTAILYGGGIYNSGRIFVANSTITGNNITANSLPTSGDGGGLFNRGIASVENSTVTNNVGISTGGIQNNSSRYGEPVELFIRNSTITGNSGIDRQGIPEPYSIGAGAGVGGNDRTAIFSSIVANNETDITGNAFSDGNNLIGNADGFDDVQDSDLVGTGDNPLDPRLGELQNNGGSTLTQALLEDSPAIDNGRNATFDGLATDQRGAGFDRTVGNGTDIGAFELQTVDNGGGMIPDELVVSTLEDENDGDFSAGDLSLREAIAISELNEIITFDSGLSGGTITLTLGELAIDKSLDIRGLGANNLTIDGNNQSRIFNVYDGDDGFLDDVSIDGLTLANGNTGEGTIPSINGGAILNRENLFVTNTAFISNRAGNGGAIYNIGQIQLDNSLVAESDGTAPLFNDGGTALVSNSTFTNNIVAGTGAIANTNGGTLDLSNSTLANNSGYDFVLSNSDDSTATVTSTIIANNEGSLFPEFSDAGGTFISGGNNLIGNNNGATGFDNPTDLVGTTDNRLDARLGELQDNGGATQTLALLEDSPAIDAGSNPNGLITDQRGDGFDRTIGQATDIGAFELQTVVTPDINEIIGTDRGDALEGTESGDRIFGLEGNDTIRGLAGDDTIEGNNGNDSLEGGAGNDSILGLHGFDSLFGGQGNDILDGGNGNDSIEGGAGNDLLFGLGDRDTLLGGDGEDTLEGGAGVDFLDGGANNDQLFGGTDNDSLRGGEGDDLLNGGVGIDSIEGGVGNDTLLGLDGADSLFGGNGNDFIDGGSGNDSLRGDDGHDTFVLASGNGTDFIVDFNRGNNLLGLSGGIGFADLTFSGNDIILGDETLATLNGVNTDNLTHSSFTSI